MAHNIDMTNGRANIAFRGNRDDVWHRLGQQAQADWSVDDWAAHAGLAWEALKVEAYAKAPTNTTGMVKADDYRFIVRSDNGHVLGCVSPRYQPVQPREVLDWFQQYISVDDRFQLDVAGSLKQGEIIWATATFNGGINVAGDKHTARLLMTTTFDGTGATINRATMTRVVCENTMNVAMADKQKSLVRTRHSTTFDAKRVGAELATIAQGFATYKAMGEAMALHKMAGEDMSKLFKTVLDIPFDTPRNEISAKKSNQFETLKNCYAVGVRQEGLDAGTAWAGLNAVTRFVDHEKATRGGNPQESRFLSGVVDMAGGGNRMKQTAIAFLEEQGISWDAKPADMASLLSQPMGTAKDDSDDVAALLKQPFKPTRG